MNDDQETPEPETAGHSSGTNVSIEVKDLLGLGKATANLKPAGMAIANGISKVWEPAGSYLQKRSDGFAARHEAFADAKLMTKLDAETGLDPKTLDQIKRRFITIEIRRQQNISHTVQLAIEQSEQSDPEQVFEVEEDFIFDWVNGVKDVSNADVQAIWASILAQAPMEESGRVSKAAMNLLRDFDANVAKSLQNILDIYDCCGLPSTKIKVEKWAEFGFEIDFEFLADLGVVSAHHNAISSTIHPFTITQVKEEAGLSRIISPISGFGVWGINRIALEIARCIPPLKLDLTDQNIEKLLEKNLSAHFDDDFFVYRLSPRNSDIDINVYFDISNKPERLWGQNKKPNTEDIAAIVSEIDKRSEAIPAKFVPVFKKFASNGCLRVTEIEDANEPV